MAKKMKPKKKKKVKKCLSCLLEQIEYERKQDTDRRRNTELEYENLVWDW